MTNLRVKWAFFVIVLLVFGYYLIPTIRYYSMSAEARDRVDPGVAKIRQNAMKLGLDLQGGSYLVYEVDIEKIDPAKRTGDEIDQAIEVIRNRVDQYGVLEPVIQKQGETRIVVQLPGLQDPARAKELVGKTARLDFLLVRTPQEFFQAMAKVDQAVARRGAGFLESLIDTTALGAPSIGDTARAIGDTTLAAVEDTTATDTTGASLADTLLATGNPFSSLFQQAAQDAGIAFCPDQNYDAAKKMLDTVAGDPAKGTPAALAGGTILLWGDRGFEGTANPGRYLYALTANAELTGTWTSGVRPSSPDSPETTWDDSWPSSSTTRSSPRRSSGTRSGAAGPRSPGSTTTTKPATWASFSGPARFPPTSSPRRSGRWDPRWAGTALSRECEPRSWVGPS
jgi:hypothetical protein